MVATSLLARLSTWATQQPDTVLLCGERTVTYGAALDEVRERAAQLAAAAQGAPVVIQGPNTAAWLLTFLAARQAGLLVMPLPEDLAVESFLPLLGCCYRVDAQNEVGQRLGDQSPSLPAEAAICLPTSGSTGEPKLVLRSEASFLTEGERYMRSLHLQSEEQILLMAPMAHAFALGWALGVTLGVGCTLHLLPRFAPRRAQAALATGNPMLLPLVPATAHLLCEALQRRHFTANVRHVVIGAGAVTPALEAEIVATFGRRPVRGYGSSETGALLGTTGEAVADGVTGKPLPGVEVALVPAGAGETLFVRTSTPFLGYWVADGIDASRLSPDGWYAMSDLARQDEDGYIAITGRLGQGLRRGGKWIQPEEVQRALLLHPAIRDAIVVGERDAAGEDVVVAYLETELNDPVALRQFLETHLAAYKIPTRWHVYTELPRTSGGKPDRKRLQQQGQTTEAPPVLSSTTTASTQGSVLPMLMAHRLSSAIVAAQQVGLWPALAQYQRATAAQLAADLQLDAQAVGVVLAVLTDAGLLHCADDGCYCVIDLLNRPELNALEGVLQQQWLSADAISAVLRSGYHQRPFEGAIPADFQTRYLQLMGVGARYNALSAWRQVKPPPGPMLDIGRPAGAWAQIARQRHCYTLELPLGHQPAPLALPPEPLAAIFLHNGVRYLGEPTTAVTLADLYAALLPGAVLIISDIFIDDHDDDAQPVWLKPSLQLDWLTHGNWGWEKAADLCAALTSLGFQAPQRKKLSPLFDLIIALK